MDSVRFPCAKIRNILIGRSLQGKYIRSLRATVSSVRLVYLWLFCSREEVNAVRVGNEYRPERKQMPSLRRGDVRVGRDSAPAGGECVVLFRPVFAGLV